MGLFCSFTGILSLLSIFLLAEFVYTLDARDPLHHGCGDHGTMGNNGLCVCDIGFKGPHCDEHNCLHGGTVEHHGHKCHCPVQYTGVYCEIVSPSYLCHRHLCRNGGHCYHDNTDYYCACPPEYTGKLCELRVVTQPPPTTPVDLCAHVQCKNGGHCSHDSTQFYCNCPHDYTGRTCETRVTTVATTVAAKPIDYCLFGPCGHGLCLNIKNGFYCYCDVGYKGKTCNIAMSACDSNPCLNGGHCYHDDTFNLFDCVCQQGFTGTKCESRVTTAPTTVSTAPNTHGISLMPLTLDPYATFPVRTTHVPTTTQAPRYKVCNEIDLILTLSNHGRIDHANARKCPANDHKQSDAILLSHCSSKNMTSWRQGLQVSTHCHRLPKYVAIAQFHNGRVTSKTGVFIVCTQSDGFELFTQTCDDDLKLSVIQWPESETFYTVEYA